MTPTPMIIALAGPSAGGKSALAQCLAPRLESPASPVLGLDSFYNGLAHLPIAERSQVNFDHPDSMDWPLMESVLEGLSKGRTMPCPVYDFKTHARTEKVRTISPGRHLIVEGLFALFPVIRGLSRVRVFVDAPQKICLERLLKRDLQERAWSQQDVIRRFEAQVWPMHLEHVLPTKQFAQVVIDGTAPLADSADAVIRFLEGETG